MRAGGHFQTTKANKLKMKKKLQIRNAIFSRNKENRL